MKRIVEIDDTLDERIGYASRCSCGRRAVNARGERKLQNGSPNRRDTVAGTGQEAEMKHTPTPWRRVGYLVVSGSERAVAMCLPDTGSGVTKIRSGDECVANAALIVRCVNAHDQLVGACEAALKYLVADEAAEADYASVWVWYAETRDKLKVALAAAEEG